jgi:hypothetical protein
VETEEEKKGKGKEKKAKKIKRHKGKGDNGDDILRMEDDPGDTQVRASRSFNQNCIYISSVQAIGLF